MSLFEHTATLFKEAMAGTNHDNEKDLVIKMQQGDLNAYKQLRRIYQPVINRMASDYRPSSGNVSLAQIKMRAEHKFPEILMDYNPEHESGTTVRHHVKTNLNRLLLNGVREHMTGPYVSRTYQDMANRYRQALREAQREYGDNPTDEQVLQFMGDDKVNTVADLQEYKKYSHESFIGDVMVGKGDDNNFLFRDQFTNDVNAPDNGEEKYTSSALDHVKDVMQRRLTPEQYSVVQDRIGGKSMAQAALDNGISTTKLRSIMSTWDKIREEEGLHL